MARNYKVEGRKDFLYWAIGLAVLGLWCVKDGWFPSPTVLEKHPPDDPADSFYLFNRTLAFITLIAAGICGYIHKVVK